MDSLLDPAELRELSSQYGAPIVWTRKIDATKKLLDRRRRALETKRGEIVLAIPRPHARVLLHTKSFYPAGAFRLLSGGIERGEKVINAVRRELTEETGFSVRPVNLLGIVEYSLVNNSDEIPWVSYIFRTEETGAEPRPADVDEQISEFREIEWQELPSVAENLEQLPPDWRDWGQFRSVPHRLVWQALA